MPAAPACLWGKTQSIWILASTATFFMVATALDLLGEIGSGRTRGVQTLGRHALLHSGVLQCGHHGLLHAFHLGGRHALGRHQTEPRRVVQVGVTGFGVGLHIGQHVQAFMPGHGDGAQLACLHMGQGRATWSKYTGTWPPSTSLMAGPTTVGNVQHFGARAALELGAPHVADGAVAGVA
jgi:hypothetical protein